eukprot:TRINITY_DN212_c0_g3_i1.p1 TRINITY_DN212_c0_g3~~TRINITY_DN212_c0_g3_i1.p1  ORF type:complete len:192 (-),score=49.61 TRINITY_DN212_c0_g3_i1:163-738(-)
MSSQVHYKFVIVGSGAVGKSSITIQYVSQQFINQYDPTIEDSYRKQVVIDERAYVLDILDTAGQEELSATQDQWYRVGNGFLLVYSITDRHSFQTLTPYWNKLLLAQNAETVPLVLVGNKCDLESDRQVSTQEGKDLAKTFGGCPHIETSAKERRNIDQVFAELVRECRKFENPKAAAGKKEKKSGGCLMM